MIKGGIQIPEPPVSRFVFADTRFAGVWLIARLYVGWTWLEAGREKAGNAAWIGENAGAAVKGFLSGALQKTSGAHPDVSGWYAYFINTVAIPNAALFSYLVTYGEIAVGLGLILGGFTGIAAFFGIIMNLNFLFAGTVSMNPLLLILGIFLVLAWRNAGWYGVDRVLLPALGVPWRPGTLFRKRKT